MFQCLNDVSIASLKIKQAEARNIGIHLLRLDQVDQHVSGNKWFKLKYNLEAAQAQGVKAVLSFGGAYSNHIHALAWAGRALGIQTIGVIRGEPEYAKNPTLSDAMSWGMSLDFVSREEYRRRNNVNFINKLKNKHGDFLVIPEGGSNALAVKGATEIVSPLLVERYGISHIVLPCGTGGTLAGVAASQPTLPVLGIPVLKGASFLYQDIEQLLLVAGFAEIDNWVLDFNGHYGGYGKAPSELLDFIFMMKDDYGIPFDQIYTGKMMFRLVGLIEEGFFAEGSQILALHTGGLQGLRSL